MFFLFVSFFWEANYGRLCKVTQSEGRARMTAPTKNALWWLWRGSCQHSASRRAQVKEKKKEKKLKPSWKSWCFSLEPCRLMNNSPKKITNSVYIPFSQLKGLNKKKIFCAASPSCSLCSWTAGGKKIAPEEILEKGHPGAVVTGWSRRKK